MDTKNDNTALVEIYAARCAQRAMLIYASHMPLELNVALFALHHCRKATSKTLSRVACVKPLDATIAESAINNHNQPLTSHVNSCLDRMLGEGVTVVGSFFRSTSDQVEQNKVNVI